jgi:hypothetical protein
MNKFEFWTNFGFEQIRILDKFQIWTKSNFEQISDLKIWTNFRFEQFSDLFFSSDLNKFRKLIFLNLNIFLIWTVFQDLIYFLR